MSSTASSYELGPEALLIRCSVSMMICKGYSCRHMDRARGHEAETI
jgi:hypothetical protein